MHPSILHQSKQTKNEEDRRLELERVLDLFSQKIWNELSLILFLCFLESLLLYFDAQRTFVAFQFAHPMTQKSLNLANESGKYWKVFDDKYMFSDVQFYPNTKEMWKVSEV